MFEEKDGAVGYQFVVKHNDVVVRRSEIFSSDNDAVKTCIEYLEAHFMNEEFKNELSTNHLVLTNTRKFLMIAGKEVPNKIEAFFYKVKYEPVFCELFNETKWIIT